jgi:hypothetical protein
MDPEFDIPPPKAGEVPLTRKRPTAVFEDMVLAVTVVVALLAAAMPPPSELHLLPLMTQPLTVMIPAL